MSATAWTTDSLDLTGLGLGRYTIHPDRYTPSVVVAILIGQGKYLADDVMRGIYEPHDEQPDTSIFAGMGWPYTQDDVAEWLLANGATSIRTNVKPKYVTLELFIKGWAKQTFIDHSLSGVFDKAILGVAAELSARALAERSDP